METKIQQICEAASYILAYSEPFPEERRSQRLVREHILAVWRDKFNTLNRPEEAHHAFGGLHKVR